MRHLLLFALLALGAGAAVAAERAKVDYDLDINDDLPAVCDLGRQYGVNDGANASDCSVGGGSSYNYCVCTTASPAAYTVIGGGGGAEVNDLEGTAPANIQDTEILVGSGSGTAAFVTVSGDATLANTGALTVGANAVALGADTTNSYIATVVAGANAGITIAGSGSETAAVTVSLTNTSAGADPPMSANGGRFENNGLIFEGVTANTIETRITVTDPTSADKTITVPDLTGTMLLSGHVTTSGLVGLISGTITDIDTEGELESALGGINVVTTADSLTAAPVYLANSFILPSGTTCTGGDVQPVASGPTQGAVNCTDAATSTFEVEFYDELYTGGTITAEIGGYQTGTPGSNLTEFDVECQCVTPGTDTPAAWSDTNTQSAQLNFDTTDRFELGGTSSITPNGTCAAGDLILCKFECDATQTTETMADVHLTMARLKVPVDWE